VETVLRDNENDILDEMDALKARRQTIELLL
jgi:hypothetical protein